MASPPADLTTLLGRLAASGADFLLVGALANALADLKRGATSAKDRLTLAILEDTLRRVRKS